MGSISFKIDGEIESFSDKQKLREFSTTKPALQQMLNGLIQSKNKREEKRSTKSTPDSSVQFGSVAQSCLTLCNPMGCSMPGFPVHHQLPELTQTHVHWVGGAIQPSHSLSSPSPPAFNLSQHQGLFQWVGSSHQVTKVLELQHQSFQWILRIDFL